VFMGSNVDLARRKRSRKTKGGAENKWFQFFTASVITLSGATAKDLEVINTCIPADWQLKDNSDVSGATKAESDTMKGVLDTIEKVVTFVCKFKEDIKKLFDKKMMYFYKKQFLQRTVTVKKDLIGAIGDFASGVISDVSKTWDDVVAIANSAIDDAVKAVGDFASKAWKDVTSVGDLITKKIKEIFIYIRKKILKPIMNNEYVKKLLTLYECAKKIGDKAKVIYGHIEKIHNKITTVIATGGVGFAKVFVDLVCNFKVFRQAADFLVLGFKETDIPKKFYLYGQFAGTLIKGLSGKRLRLMKLYVI